MASRVRAPRATALALTAPGPEPDEAARPVGAWRRLLKDPAAMAGAVVALLFILLAVFAPAICAINGVDPYTYHVDLLDGSGVPVGRFGGASAAHWFGVEPLTGRDLFAIVAYGARTSLPIGVGATALSVTIGVAMGTVSGYLGGLVDMLLSRFTDLMIAFPSLIFMIALSALVPPSFPKPVFMVLIIGLFSWPSMARVTRGQTLSFRNRSFVMAARAIGSRSGTVLATQILPNIAPTIIVIATMGIPGAITAEAALSFLGIGIAPPTPSWGRAIASAVAWIRVDPWFLLAPGLALFLVTLAFNLFGDGLRDVLDPKLAKRAS